MNGRTASVRFRRTYCASNGGMKIKLNLTRNDSVWVDLENPHPILVIDGYKMWAGIQMVGI